VQDEIPSLANILKLPLFQTLLGLFATDSDILLAAVHLPSNGGCKLLIGNGLDDCLQARLEALLEQQEASQFRFHPWEEKKVY
jgi:hypothetical protein